MFSIIDLTINRSGEDTTGLFSGISVIGSAIGTVTNLHLINVNISGNEYVGGFSGFTNGKIQNCTMTGKVTGVADSIGGISGELSGFITNVSTNGEMNGYWDIGGIVGTQNGGFVNNSRSSSIVSGDRYVGGLVGRIAQGTLQDSFSNGLASGKYTSGRTIKPA